ncbi:MAG: NAD(P)/FAD-dependent oxidoreductase [Steroidobacteraceae bacterium]
MDYDAVIVGGSYAGLAAATQLARARRSVLVVDGGRRRNRFAEHSHGFLTQDGAAAGAIVAEGRRQLLAYETVRWLDGEVVDARPSDGAFRLVLDDMTSIQARRIVLATGVVDVLPDLPGLADRWGRRVFHCPYCHGYELDRGRIGVLGVSSLSLHQALMLPDWGPTTLFLHDACEPNREQRAQLEARGVKVEAARVRYIDGDLDLHLEDGRLARLDGLFVATRIQPASPLAQQLGCEVEESVLGRTIKTDAMKATAVPGVYACGDLARPGGSVAAAVGDGTLAGAAAHQSLIFAGLSHAQ